MQRSISIHPASLLIGLALAAVVFLTMSQSAPITPGNIRVVYGPDPRDMVQIDEGTPYTVPTGKLFVSTGLGSAVFSQGSQVSLAVNGQVEMSSVWLNPATYNAGSNGCLICEVPTGFTAVAGSVLSVSGGYQSSGRAWGYLAPQ